uniref:F-box protein 34 n=1 Tax=Leptobrachium leishanense TaxID=445787 RepID=A0A8C5MY29_9ANUR
MHLKPYHKVQKKESSPETRPSRGMQRNNQSSAKEDKCNGDKPPRRPLGAISHNTMCNTVGLTQNSFEARARSVQPATIHQGEEGEGPLDICAIIKPGNTKEKIALFAAHHYSNLRNSSMKIKCTANMNGRAAKRRKKSVDLKRVRSQLEKMQESQKCFLSEPFPSGLDNCSINYVADGDGLLPDRPLSVIEMVAFLEQRASSLLSDYVKPFTNNHQTPRPPGTCSLPASVSLMALGPREVLGPDEDEAEKNEQLESVCVLEMVAKLESECLRHQNEREAGSLSRSNSFRRNVGRMLLVSSSELDTNGNQKGSSVTSGTVGSLAASPDVSTNKDGFLVKPWTNCAPSSPEKAESSPPVEDLYVATSDLELVRETCLKIRGQNEHLMTAAPCQYSFSLHIAAVERAPESRDINRCAVDEKADSADVLMHAVTDHGVVRETLSSLSYDSCPGTLFFQHAHRNARVQINAEVKTQMEIQEKTSCEGRHNQPITQYTFSLSSLEHAPLLLDGSSMKKSVSHDFLETRFKIQQLLEPQQYMIFLPHHILVKIFQFLPTRTLAALKCTVCYFKFIIEHYDIRPSDSLWVRDPRYKDDPCKQCKKKYAKGDVSLCWWHPKPYCQALPYGPGYWMCCHMSPKESRGCKVGLHDNRWVPACHSFNRTICKKSEAEDD